METFVRKFEVDNRKELDKYQDKGLRRLVWTYFSKAILNTYTPSGAYEFSEDNKKMLQDLQSRKLIENPQELEKVLAIVFRKFAPWVEAFQIANAVNRTKWGFFSIDEYLRFYQVAYQLKKKILQFKTIKHLFK